MLTANQKYIDTANIKHLLGAGEKNADKIQIAVDRYYHQTDLSDCLFTLRAVNSGGGLVMQNLEKEVTESQIILTWTITEDFTAVSGQRLPEIVGQKDDTVVIKYEMTPKIDRNSILDQYNAGIDAIPFQKHDSGCSEDVHLPGHHVPKIFNFTRQSRWNHPVQRDDFHLRILSLQFFL